MKYGKTIRIDGVNFNNPNLPVLRDFQTLIANHAHCVGAWRLDGADPVVLDASGGVQSFSNWKTNGSPLVLGGGQAATLVDNALTGGKLARMSAAGEYRLDGYALDLTKSYTMVAVYKPDSYNVLGNVCGDLNQSDMTKTSAIFSRKNGATPAIAMFEANNTLYQNVLNESVLIAAIARHDGTAKHNYLTGVGVGLVSGASTGAAASGAMTFKVSDQALYPFLGLLDFIALFDINTAADTALQTALADYLAIRVKPV
ncbi:hypothetical protein H4C80_00275 [Pseudomonas juntendi]|uniref:Uncharacterized protein n=1 Tax=Pseudomonas juntendi TaxID=2666183 RepID=A0A7W2KBR3_9PSED|nr:hypothetical protein [Pseudomonas juntendi]MBA6095584.1 hypothetical protein [Pseudomonas juntendi]